MTCPIAPEYMLRATPSFRQFGKFFNGASHVARDIDTEGAERLPRKE